MTPHLRPRPQLHRIPPAPHFRGGAGCGKHGKARHRAVDQRDRQHAVYLDWLGACLKSTKDTYDLQTINARVKAPLSQPQADALGCLIYNIGDR